MNAQRVLILGCSQRKRHDSAPLPAIDRYDGPTFRILRSYMRDGHAAPQTFVLSAKFGLIDGNAPIPNYDEQMTASRAKVLADKVRDELTKRLQTHFNTPVLVCAGRAYRRVIDPPLTSLKLVKLENASGPIGKQSSLLRTWLRGKPIVSAVPPKGSATLLGTTVSMSAEDVRQTARRDSLRFPRDAHRYETWYVEVDTMRIAPKWLASRLFDKPVSSFRTSDARRVLALLGVESLHAHTNG